MGGACYTLRVVLHLAPGHLAAISKHAVEAYPQECCGLLLGTAAAGWARVTSIVPAENHHAEPRHGFELAPGVVA